MEGNSGAVVEVKRRRHLAMRQSPLYRLATLGTMLSMSTARS